MIAQYAEEFDRCTQWIEPALEYARGCLDLEDIKAAVMTGKMQLWPGQKSALITEIVQHPCRVQCHIGYAGGDLDELRAMAPKIIEWAKAIGCDHITVSGRKGWIRALGMGEISHTTSWLDI